MDPLFANLIMNPQLMKITPEFFNNIKYLGLPIHILNLKVGVPIMLMKNIDQSNGLCNGTRLIVSRLESHVIEAKGRNPSSKIYIPKMTLIGLEYPFTFQRSQFPIIVPFAMTIN